MRVAALLAEAEIRPVQEGVLDFHASELALLGLGALATVVALAVGVALFVHASREERRREQRERETSARERASPSQGSASEDAS